jgi:hypothetical protein
LKKIGKLRITFLEFPHFFQFVGQPSRRVVDKYIVKQASPCLTYNLSLRVTLSYLASGKRRKYPTETKNSENDERGFGTG